jgi:signal transduction histidine kinase
MPLQTWWVAAEVCFGLGAATAVSVTWSVWRRATPGYEAAFLCSSLAALAIHYAALSADAWLHAAAGAMAAFTPWSAWARASLLVSAGLFFAFLLTVVRRLYAPHSANPWLFWAVALPSTAALLAALGLTTRLVGDQLGGAAPSAVASDVERFFTGPGRLLASLLFTGPLAFCSALLDRAPSHGEPRWERWLAQGGPWQLITRPRRGAMSSDARHAPRHTARLLVTSFAVVAVSLTGAAGQGVPFTWTPLSLALMTAGDLFLLPIVVGLVYVHARPVFFDVVLKRGALNLGLTVVTLAGCALAFAALSVQPAAGTGIVCIALTIFVWLVARAYEHAGRAVDRVLFRRADYPRALSGLSERLAACADADALRAALVTELQAVFEGAQVRHVENVSDSPALTVGLGRPEQGRGYLTLGPRAGSRAYASEDLTFVSAATAQFVAHLEAIEAMDARHATTVAELKALRAQINPHFLFNALSTLAEMARDQPATERTILNLASVFRYALESTQYEHLPLSAELDAVRAYLEIEAERFDDRFQFEVHAADDTLDALVPPMLLQPLVENAVRHGVASATSQGLVRIVATRISGHLHLVVEDNGVGFDPTSTPRRVGLANVATRVERTGGSWDVQSRPGAGTTVRLALVAS